MKTGMGYHVGARLIALAITIASGIAAQSSTLSGTQPVPSGPSSDGPGACVQDADCARWNYWCTSAFEDEYLYTYDFTADFKDLPSAFMPTSGKGCNLILRSSSGQEPNEQNLQDFHGLQAFPYCSKTQSQDKNQKQAEPKDISRFGVEYEKRAKGNTSWYVLEKLRNVDAEKVYGEALYRVADGTASKKNPGNLRSLLFSSPYKNGVGAVNDVFLQKWRGDEASRNILDGELPAIEREMAKYFIYVDKTTRKSCQPKPQ